MQISWTSSRQALLPSVSITCLAAIVFRDKGSAWVVYLFFREAITGLVWTSFVRLWTRPFRFIHDVDSSKQRNRRIPIICPGLISVQKTFLLGLFTEELIFGRTYYWKEFCV